MGLEDDFMKQFDIAATASYIVNHGFTRVALQFPDHLLEISVKVTSLLRSALDQEFDGINLYVMADTTYGSCCVDEIAAAHVDAQCIVHYGDACLSQTSRLPVYFVFGEGRINTHQCSEVILGFSSLRRQPLLVLFGLQYAHAVNGIKNEVQEKRNMDAAFVVFAEVPSCQMEPLQNLNVSVRNDCTGTSNESEGASCCQGICTSQGCGELRTSAGCAPCKDLDPALSNLGVSVDEVSKQDRMASSRDAESVQHSIGGLTWLLPKGMAMDDFAIVWIGDEGAALTNLMLTYDSHTIARYNAADGVFVTDLPSKSRDLMRRFYLVERAKEASIVGIVVGTLGVAGYIEAIQRVRDIVASAGKKSYTMVMGRPNPAKLANFPECDVFVLVACAQTILLDSKEYLAPLITPFEAELAFGEGREWTGAFSLGLSHLQWPDKEQSDIFHTDETLVPDDGDDNVSRALILSEASDLALQIRPTGSLAVAGSGRTNTGVRSSSEYLALRSYQGLEKHDSGVSEDATVVDNLEDVLPASFQVVEGRTGRAAGYKDEAAIV